MRADAARGMEGKSYNYLRKLGLIQKNLYGLDIQPLATLIAKLRFFLTLVIEQEVNPTDRAHNYGLAGLAESRNQSALLQHLDRCVPWPAHRPHPAPTLRTAREEYYQPQTSAEPGGRNWRKISAMILRPFSPDLRNRPRGSDPQTLSNAMSRISLWIAEWFKHATVAAPFFNVETFFPELVDGGTPQHPSPFHIVIGNPPYGGNKISDDVKNALGLGSKDPYGAFIARFLGNPRRPTPLAARWGAGLYRQRHLHDHQDPPTVARADACKIASIRCFGFILTPSMPPSTAPSFFASVAASPKITPARWPI